MKVPLASLILFTSLLSSALQAATVMIPAGTRIFGELEEVVSSDHKKFEVGEMVRGRAWRNVVVDGQTVISAGAPMVLRISALQKNRTFGRAGSVEVQAVSVTAIDGNDIFLDGGYDKKGENRVVLSSTLAALVAWPTLFIKGKEAVLDPGTVFDAAIPANTNVTVSDDRPRTLRLNQVSDLSIEILYDDLEEDSRDLPLRLTLCDEEWAEPVQVTAVNSDEIKPIEVVVTSRNQEEACQVADGMVDLKDLSDHFRRGINRFSVTVGAETAEVILDVEM